MPLHQQILSSIYERIRSGEWQVHDRFPSENELSEEFRVSRMTVRKCMDQLVQEGIVSRTRGSGTYLLSPPAAEEPKESAGNRIAVLLPSLNNMFAVRMLSSIESHLSANGYRVMFVATNFDIGFEKQVLAELGERQDVRGLLIYPTEGSIYNEKLLELALNDYPMVLMDRYLKGCQTHVVTSDNVGGAYEAVRYLIQQGHREIGYITSDPKGTSSLEERLEGYEKALSEAAIPYRSSQVLLETDHERIKHMLQANPQMTAIFSAVNYGGKLVMDAAQELGLHVPQDISLIFFDDYDFSTYTKPQPTVVDQDAAAIGRIAAEELLDTLRDPEREKRRILIPTKLILRETVRPCTTSGEEV